MEATRKKFESMKKKKKTKKKALKEESVSREGTEEPEAEGKESEEKKAEEATEEKKAEESTEEKPAEQKPSEKAITASAEKSTKTDETSLTEEPKTAIAEKDDLSKTKEAPLSAAVSTEAKVPETPLATTHAEKAHSHTDKYNPISPAPDSENVNTLKELIEQQKATIKKLRDENTDLKLSRMDFQDRISELELEVEQLKLYTPTAHEPLPQTSSMGATSFLASPIKPAKPVFTRNDYASESKQNIADQKQSADFREQLMVWKGWQVDMTQWHGSSNAQVVAL